MGHLLLILIVQLATIQRLNEGKFYCDYSSNEPYDIEGDYAIDKNVFEKKFHHCSLLYSFVCPRNGNAAQGPTCDELLF